MTKRRVMPAPSVAATFEPTLAVSRLVGLSGGSGELVGVVTRLGNWQDERPAVRDTQVRRRATDSMGLSP